MANRTKMNEERVERLLAALSEGASITKAAELSGIGRRTVYDWRAQDPEFSAAFEDAYQRGVAVLEDEAFRRAHDGVQRPVYYKGAIVDHVREFSDSLLMFLLKARDPRFRDKTQVEMTGKDGGPIKTEGIDFSKLSTDELRHALALAARASIKVV